MTEQHLNDNGRRGSPEAAPHLEAVLGRLKGVSKYDGYHKALCPSHDDREPSLSIRLNSESKVSIKCHAGCSDLAILERIGLTVRDLYPENVNGHAKRKKKVAKVYDYHDLGDNVIHQTVRYKPKDFRQRRPDGSGRYVWNLRGVEPVLYRLPEVVEAIAEGRTVFIVEGEQDADNARERLGITATTCPMGAGTWRPSYTKMFKGADAVLIPDNDGTGAKHMQDVATQLVEVAASVKIVELPGLDKGGDLSDWIDAGGTGEQLSELVRAAGLYDPTEPGKERPTHELTDVGNAYRFVDQHGDRVRWCPAMKSFLLWDGKRWAKDECGEVVKLAQETARSIHHEAARARGKDEQRQISKWAVTSQSATRINAMLSQAQPHIAVRMDALDTDPMLLNCTNGTIDLRTGELREHDPKDLITKLSPEPYNPEATAPRFERFLREVLVDEGVITFVQRFAGYSLTGDTRERVMAILWGSGKNGKSTLVELLRDVMGDYADNTDVETILLKKYNGVGNDVAALKGARLVSTAEVEKGRRLAESKIKNLTGQDTVTARFLFGEPFSFRPEFKVWLSTNNKPEIQGTDDAIWDRIRLVPFTQRFTGESQDRDLAAELRKELPGVLAWMVAGCLDWQRDGLGEPEQVKAATDAYRAEMDVLAVFIDERCVVHPNAQATMKDLFAAWEHWCGVSGEDAGTKRAFGSRLTERGFEAGRGTSNAPIRKGIGLLSDHTPPDGNDPDPPDGESGPEGGSQGNSTPPVVTLDGTGNEPGGGKTTPTSDSKVTTDPESYPRVTAQNTCKTGRNETVVTLSYLKTKKVGLENPREETYWKQGNYGNYGNSGDSGTTSRRLTEDEAQQVQRLIAEGMESSFARSAVLGELEDF